MLVVKHSCSTSFLFRLQHPFSGVFSAEEWHGEYVVSEREKTCKQQPPQNNCRRRPHRFVGCAARRETSTISSFLINRIGSLSLSLSGIPCGTHKHRRARE